MAKPKNDVDIDDDSYDKEGEDIQEDKFLTSRLADEEYGIEICHVTEIVGMQKITSLRGMINLRGKVIPVLDARTRFKIPLREYGGRTNIIVLNINDSYVGVVVDSVRDVAVISESEIESPTKIQEQISNAFIKGMCKVGEDVKILLNVDKLFFEKKP